jgi:1-hydroxycarotenoid 3,4-desaturase
VTTAQREVIIIGAGVGGLVSAALLAAQGVRVTVLEQAAQCGGKIRQLPVGDAMIDAGPTVFTLRSVIDDIFASAGANTEDYITLTRAERIARHAWDAETQLDLYADPERSADAIGDFAGAKAAAGFRSFSAEAARIYTILDRPFLRMSKPYPPQLMARIGLWRIGDLIAIRPYESLWSVLKEHFDDPRLLQLFGRYTTYCGSSPFLTPATLMLIAHVEAQGVWSITGGMSALANALERLAREKGAEFRYGCSAKRILSKGRQVEGVELDSGEVLYAPQVIFNGDPAALASGLLGPDVRKAVWRTPEKSRSLSALVWLAHTQTSGFDLDHHSVFFSSDYAAEFRDLTAGRAPSSPTAYICALDRAAGVTPTAGQAERLHIIVNAPPHGDSYIYSEQEKERCTAILRTQLARCGLMLDNPLHHQLVTPTDFATRFPATGGALYGRASHGWAASFLRPGSRTAIRGLYCAGGATHPGAGVPMAALSGMMASQAVLSDPISTRLFRPVATAGGISTPSAMTNVTG